MLSCIGICYSVVLNYVWFVILPLFRQCTSYSNTTTFEILHKKITRQIMDLSIFILTNKRSNFTLWARNSVSSSDKWDKYYCSLCYVSFCNYCFFLLFIFKNYITEKLIMMWEKMKLCSNYMPLIANKLQYSSYNIW